MLRLVSGLLRVTVGQYLPLFSPNYIQLPFWRKLHESFVFKLSACIFEEVSHKSFLFSPLRFSIREVMLRRDVTKEMLLAKMPREMTLRRAVTRELTPSIDVKREMTLRRYAKREVTLRRDVRKELLLTRDVRKKGAAQKSCHEDDIEQTGQDDIETCHERDDTERCNEKRKRWH